MNEKLGTGWRAVITAVLFLSLLLPRGASLPPAHAAPQPPDSASPAPLPPTATPQPSVEHIPPVPSTVLPMAVEEQQAQTAMQAVLDKYLQYWGPRYHAALSDVSVEGEWAYAIAEWQSEERTLKEDINLVAKRLPDGTWQALMPSSEGLYIPWLDAMPKALIPDSQKVELLAQAVEADKWKEPQPIQSAEPTVAPVLSSKEQHPSSPSPILSQPNPTATPMAIAREEDSSSSRDPGIAPKQSLVVRHRGDKNVILLVAETSGSEEVVVEESVTSLWLPAFERFITRSPDGLHATYVTADDLMLHNAHWWLVDLDSMKRQLLAIFPDELWVAPFVWSPDGKRIAFVKVSESSAGSKDVELWMINIESNEQSLVIANPSFHSDLFSVESLPVIRWATDSNKLTFTDYEVRDVSKIEYEVDLSSLKVSASKSDMTTSELSRASVLATLPCGVTQFSQNDPEWRDDIMQTCGTTIGAEGCALTSSAMAFRYYDVETSPRSLNQCLGNAACPLYWGTAAANCSSGKVSWQGAPGFSWATVEAELNAGRPPIVSLTCPSYPHFVIVVSGSGSSYSGYTINDPWDGQVKSLSSYSSCSTSGLRLYAGTPWCQTGDCPQSGGVILYWNNNYNCDNDQGDPGYRQRTSTGWENISGAFNDQASSLKVPSGWSVRLYEHSDKGGASVCRNGDDSDFAGDYFDGGSVPLNDHVSSFEVFDNSDCGAGPQYPVTLYEHPDYNGAWCALTGEGWANVCGGFNDVASSIRLQPGWSARLYEHSDRGGSSRCFNSDDSNFSDNTFENGSPLDNQVSSFEAFHNTSCTPPCSPPSAPSLSSPSNGAKLYPEDDLVFNWSGNASEYQVHWWGGPGIDNYSSWMGSTSWNVGQQWESPNAYYWQVKGRNSTGCEGSWSSTWEFRIGPRAPSNLTASAVSCSQINLSWQDNSSTESDYHIERSPNGSSWQQIATVSGTAYQDTGLSANTTYYYRVRAHRHNDDTYSKYSNTASATTQSCPAPAPPTLVSPSNGAQLPHDADITLDWNSSSGATEYYAHLWGGPSIDINSGWIGNTDWHIGQLWPGIYQWQAKARNAGGESGWSTTWSFTVQSEGPDLIPFQGGDWQYPVVPSSVTGTHTVNTLYAGLPTYMDWGVINVGDTEIPGSFHVDLYFDDTQFIHYPFTWLGAWWYYAFNDWSTTFLSSGWHTLRIVVDPENEVAESDETNNIWEFSFYWTCADPYESNDSWDTATAISYRQQHSNAYICPAGDHDYFAFVGNTGDQIIVDIDAQVAGSALDSYLYLLDSDGQTVLAYNDDHGSLDSYLEYALPHDGMFYLKVRDYWDPDVGGPGYFYTLSLAGASSTAPVFDTMEWGTNGWVATGFWHQVDLYSSPYPEVNSPTHSWWYGQDGTGDYDNGAPNSGELTAPAIYVPGSGYYLHFWYWYETETQGTTYDQRWIQISANAGPFTNVVQLASDPMQTWLPGPVIDLSPYAGQIIQVRFAFDSIDSVLNEYRGWYIDDFSISTDPPVTCGDAYEPNNTPGYAAIMTYSQTMTADICPNGDVDFYSFEGLTGDSVVVDIDAQVDGSLLDSYIYLLDSDGSTVLAQNDDEYYSLDSHLGYALTHDGTYYIKVRKYGHPYGGGPDYFYSISLFNDTEDPYGEITYPVSGSYISATNTVNITVDAGDGQSGVRNVTFLWHSGDWSDPDWVVLGEDWYAADGWSFGWDVSSLTEQSGMALYVWVWDWSGKWGGAGSWGLTLDRTAPTTAMWVSVPYGGAHFIDFWVGWYGSDNASGITSYDVQYRDGSAGSWNDWLLGTTESSTRFVGDDGHTYYFQSRARDGAGNVGTYPGGDGQVQYTVQLCPVTADNYEPDDAFGDAQWITLGGISQTHNMHIDGDQDWVKFHASVGVTYTVATTNTGGYADTVLYLYDIDGTTLIASNDDYPGMWPSSRIDWQPAANGIYYVQVVHWDPWAYGCETVYGLSILTNDSTAPMGDVIINEDATYATTPSVLVDLPTSDVGTGVSMMMIANTDDFAGAAWVSYIETLDWNLLAGNGLRIVYAKFQDRAGNVSDVYNDSIILDTILPVGSVSIDGGATYATTTTVTLDLSASDANGVAQMRFSNNGTSYSSWVPYATSYNWTLTNGDGLKTVYAQFQDSAGNVSSPASDDIILDMTLPVGTVDIDGGATYATSTTVTLDLSASDTNGVTHMRFSNDGASYGSWVAYTTNYSWTLTAGDGLKTVYAQFRDSAGNVSSPVSDDIILDTTLPVGTVDIDGGATYAATTTVTLDLSASDTNGVTDMRFSNDGVSYASWVAYANSYSWTLTAGDGLKTVYAQFKDGAGNVSSAASDDIILDTIAPVGTVTINEGAIYVTSTLVMLDLSASDTNGVDQMRFSNDGTSYSEWISYTASHEWTLDAGDGLRTVYAQFEDTAGNASSTCTDTVDLDTLPPTTPAIGTSPAITDTDAITLALSIPSTDIHFATYQIWGGQYGDAWTDTPETLTFAFTLTQDMSNTLGIRGRDIFNHIGEADWVSIIEDSVAPEQPGQPIHNDETANPGFDDDTMLSFSWSPAWDANGISQYQIYVSVDGEPFEPATTSLTNSCTLSGENGHSYRVEVNAVDYADHASPQSMASEPVVCDTMPPTSAVGILEPVQTNVTFTVTWDGGDADGSGVQGYDLQYRDSESGPWEQWITNTLGLSATFTGHRGQTYYFRSRAIDHAGNVELWPTVPDWDTRTTISGFYIYLPIVLRYTNTQ